MDRQAHTGGKTTFSQCQTTESTSLTSGLPISSYCGILWRGVYLEIMATRTLTKIEQIIDAEVTRLVASCKTHALDADQATQLCNYGKLLIQCEELSQHATTDAHSDMTIEDLETAIRAALEIHAIDTKSGKEDDKRKTLN